MAECSCDYFPAWENHKMKVNTEIYDEPFSFYQNNIFLLNNLFGMYFPIFL